MTTTKRRSGTETQPETIQQEPVSLAHVQRNPGMPLDMDWVDRVHINRSAVERRAATMSTDRKSTRLNSSHSQISYAVFCLKKKTHIIKSTSVDDILARPCAGRFLVGANGYAPGQSVCWSCTHSWDAGPQIVVSSHVAVGVF